VSHFAKTTTAQGFAGGFNQASGDITPPIS